MRKWGEDECRSGWEGETYQRFLHQRTKHPMHPLIRRDPSMATRISHVEEWLPSACRTQTVSPGPSLVQATV